MKSLKLIFNSIRLCPHLLIYLLNPQKINVDIVFWCKCLNIRPQGGLKTLFFLLCTYEEFRSLFYYRYFFWRFLRYIAPGRKNLFIATNKIGKGFFIQHGFSTIISAKSIGDYCWVNQQVTLGYSKGDNPIIGNNVRIGAGAIVIGGITIGENVTVGAGCTVVKNICANSLVVSAPCRILKNHVVKKQ